MSVTYQPQQRTRDAVYLRVLLREVNEQSSQRGVSRYPTVQEICRVLSGIDGLVQLNAYEAVESVGTAPELASELAFSDDDWQAIVDMLDVGISSYPGRGRAVLLRAIAQLSSLEQGLLAELVSKPLRTYAQIAQKLGVSEESIGTTRRGMLERLRGEIFKINSEFQGATVEDVSTALGERLGTFAENPLDSSQLRAGVFEVRLVSLQRNSPMEIFMLLGSGVLGLSAGAAVVATRLRSIIRLTNEARVEGAKTRAEVAAYEVLTTMLRNNAEVSAAGGRTSHLASIDSRDVIAALLSVEEVELVDRLPER